MSTNEPSTKVGTPGQNDPACPTYVVLEHDVLISADLIQAIESRGPCRVVHAASASEMGDALSRLDRVDAAFLELRFDEAVASSLSAELARHGARLILTLGEDVERVVAQGWNLLLRPFTERMVHDTLSEG